MQWQTSWDILSRLNLPYDRSLDTKGKELGWTQKLTGFGGRVFYRDYT